MTCDNCFHYVSSPVRKGYGHCHRKSPTADATGKAVWPMVYQTDWCSEYDPMVLRKPEAAKLDADGWIEWSGGECPVDPDTLVDLFTRDDRIHTKIRAKNWRWPHDGERMDIIAYRICKWQEG